MSDDDLKKILAELNLSHHAEALGKVAAARSKVVMYEECEGDDEALQKQIIAANKILRRRSWAKVVGVSVVVVMVVYAFAA